MAQPSPYGAVCINPATTPCACAFGKTGVAACRPAVSYPVAFDAPSPGVAPCANDMCDDIQIQYGGTWHAIPNPNNANQCCCVLTYYTAGQGETQAQLLARAWGCCGTPTGGGGDPGAESINCDPNWCLKSVACDVVGASVCTSPGDDYYGAGTNMMGDSACAETCAPRGSDAAEPTPAWCAGAIDTFCKARAALGITNDAICQAGGGAGGGGGGNVTHDVKTILEVLGIVAAIAVALVIVATIVRRRRRASSS